MTYVVRTTVDPASMIASIKQRVWSVDPLQTFYDVGAVEDMIAASLRPRVLALRLVLLLSASRHRPGARGDLWRGRSVIRRRTSEFGVRVALGATGSDIRRLIVLYGLRLTVAGIAIGLVATMLLTRLMEAFLFDVSPTDPATFVASRACSRALSSSRPTSRPGGRRESIRSGRSGENLKSDKSGIWNLELKSGIGESESIGESAIYRAIGNLSGNREIDPIPAISDSR